MTALLNVYEDVSCSSETLIRFQNLIGAPIVSALVLDAPEQGGGNAPPDELILDFIWDSANSEWDVNVTRKDGSSYHVDGITPASANQNNIIPGVTLEIAALSIVQNYQAKVNIGWNPGIIVAGNQSSDKRFFVKNIGDTDGSDARIRILPDGDFHNTVNEPIRAISELRYQKDTPTGVYEITVTADTNVIEVSYEGNPPVSVTIAADGVTPNEIATGLWVVFNSGLSEGDSGTIDISNGNSRILIAPDNNGTPGTFGVSDVVFGNMSVGEVKSFWARMFSYTYDSPTGNPRHANLQARITSI